jgi:hypothetical protein
MPNLPFPDQIPPKSLLSYASVREMPMNPPFSQTCNSNAVVAIQLFPEDGSESIGEQKPSKTKSNCTTPSPKVSPRPSQASTAA